MSRLDAEPTSYPTFQASAGRDRLVVAQMSPSENVLPVMLAGMSERTRALLAWHLERQRPVRLAQAASHEDARALFIDADHPEAIALLDANRGGERLPVVLLAVDPLRYPALEPVIEVIAKPVSASELARVASRLSSGEPLLDRVDLVTNEEDSSQGHDTGDDGLPAVAWPDPETIPLTVPPYDAPPYDTPRDDDPATLARKAARVDALFGRADAGTATSATSSLTAALESASSPYDPQAHLGARLQRELDLARQDRQALPVADRRGPTSGFILAMTHIELYVLPDIDRVYVSAKLGRAVTSRLTFSALGSDDLTVTHYRGPTMPVLLERVRDRASSGYTIDGFVWLAALMGSQGRLPVGCDPAQPYRLRHWPNLTRLEPLPTSIEIAGCWAAGSASVHEVIERTGVQPRFVHAFLAAATALGALVVAPFESHRERQHAPNEGRDRDLGCDVDPQRRDSGPDETHERV